ncbi:MAG: alpha/beta fold hydrolase [Dehalococcoidia bacterium]|nr:alpha/beta fold hydrolase [Dehalococcoidia bacterium]
MPERHVFFTNSSLTLEGALAVPDGPSPFPGAVVCHPHPLHGGDMNNNVVVGVAEALVLRGFVTLRFNFRGVGASQGSHADGIGEQEDVIGALNFLASQPTVQKNKTSLVGYSFGAVASLRVAAREPLVHALALIGCPHGAITKEAGALGTVPRIVIAGDRDSVAPAATLKQLTETILNPADFLPIPGADHAYWGYEQEIGQAVATFFKKHL